MDQFVGARKGNLSRVQELVTAANVDKQDAGKQTALHNACQGGWDEVAAWLIGVGADVDAQNSLGWTPLHCCAFNNSSRCAHLLLEAGADAAIATNDGKIPLNFAYMSAECCALLIAAHPTGVYHVRRDGTTPLHRAADLGLPEVCHVLLEAGSVVDAVDKGGHTPLYGAICSELRENAELLLDHGAQFERATFDLDASEIPEWAVSFVARRNACRSSCRAMLELTRRRSQVIGTNNRDVLGLIARIIWHSRRDKSWGASTKQ